MPEISGRQKRCGRLRREFAGYAADVGLDGVEAILDLFIRGSASAVILLAPRSTNSQSAPARSLPARRLVADGDQANSTATTTANAATVTALQSASLKIPPIVRPSPR